MSRWRMNLCRDDLDLLPHLGADGLHDLAALGAEAGLLRQRMLDLDDLHILRKNVPCAAGLPLTRMRTHFDGRLFFRFVGINLRLIEEQAELLVHFLRRFLRGSPKLLTVNDAELLQQPLVLRLQVLVFRTGDGHHLRRLCNILSLFHGSILPCNA